MSVDLDAIAEWSYDGAGLLKKLSAPTGEVMLDIASNIPLHNILRAQHWETTNRDVYSDNPADWVERDIRWNRAMEDPPVVRVEQTIGGGDYVDYSVIELEDAPGYQEILEAMAVISNDGVLNGYTKSHERQYVKKIVQLFQLAGLIAGSDDV